MRKARKTDIDRAVAIIYQEYMGQNLGDSFTLKSPMMILAFTDRLQFGGADPAS